MKKLLLILSLVAGTAFAEPSDYLPNFTADSFSASASLGILGGEAKEMVYYTEPGLEGKKMSQLDWKIKNVPILKLNLSWDPYSFLTLNARGWISLTSRGRSFMRDQDWLVEDYYRDEDDPDDDMGCPDCVTGEAHFISESPNTKVKYAYEFDINAKVWVVPLETFKAGITFGYQQERFKWAAAGGWFSYCDGTLNGDFGSDPVVNYKQRFSTPYVGLAAQFRWKDFEINGVFKFSDWVTAKDRDDHPLRPMLSFEKANNMRYYGFAGYHVIKNGMLFVEFNYNKYRLTKADTTAYADGEPGTEKNAVGIGKWN